MFESIRSLIEQYDTIILHRHTKPDGDAIGSQIGLKHLILDNFPGKRVFAVGDGAGRYAFMKDSTPDEVADETYNGALAIVLDTSARALISDSRYTTAAETARLDHHIFCEQIAAVEVTDTSFESCCGLITALAMEAGWHMSSTAATLLYTGMVTDSGRFRYDSTTPDTLRRAAYLAKEAEVRAALAEMPTSAEIEEFLGRVGMKIEAFYDFYGAPRIRDAIRYAKELKNRYSVLWVAHDLGIYGDL
jgi:phosphoesterase RecJ-like protein